MTRFRVNARKPEARGVCDRCGLQYSHKDLQWQFEWQGPRLQNKRILVCNTGCLDVPQQQLRTIIIPADPLPIMNPRPEIIPTADNNVAVLGQNAKSRPPYTPAQLPGSVYGGGSFSNFVAADAAFDSNTNKPAAMCANVPVSANSTANYIGVRFSIDPSGMSTPLRLGQIPNQELPQVHENLAGFTMVAPNNSAFMGSSYPVSYALYSYSDSYSSDTGATTTTQTLIYSGTTAGTVGEVVSVTGLSVSAPVFKFYFTGDGVHSLAVAQIELLASGPGTVTLGTSAY